MFWKIDVLKNFAVFTGKHLCCSLFLIKLIESPDETCSKIEKAWFLLAHWVAKTVKRMKNPKAVVRRCSVNKRFLNIFRSSQENNCTGVSTEELFEFNWTNFRILIWCRQLNIQNNISTINFAHRSGNDLFRQNTKFYGDRVFLSRWRLFGFLNFMKVRPNLIKATLREVWPWHLRSKNSKITRKSGLKFCKVIFLSKIK